MRYDRYLRMFRSNVPRLSRAAKEEHAAELALKGIELAHGGNFKEALPFLQQAVLSNPRNSKAWYNAGFCLIQLGQWGDVALRCFEKATMLDPDDADAWNIMGRVFDETEDYLGALSCYQRATEVAPDNPKGWKNLGQLYEKLGNKKTAKQCLKTAKKLSKGQRDEVVVADQREPELAQFGAVRFPISTAT